MRTLNIAPLLCTFLVLCLPLASEATPGDVLLSFAAPAAHPTGLTFDGELLWTADRFTDQLYGLDPDTGEILRQLPAPGFVPRGLAWDGECLWCIDAETELIYRIDPTTGETVRHIWAPTASPQGLTWDGECLWLCDDRDDVIARISPDDGTTIRTFRAPGGDSQGLVWDGQYLWCSDRRKDRIYMVDPETGDVLLSIDAPGAYSRGLTWQEGTLWNVDFQTDTISRLVVRDGVNIKTTDPRRQRLLMIQELANYGPGELTGADVYLALPTDRSSQTILSRPVFDPEPTTILTDRWDQRFAHIHRDTLPLAERHLFTMTVDAELYDTRWFVYPDEVGSLADIPRKIRKRYLVDEDKYRINDPVIQAAVKEALGDEKRPYWIMRKIYRYLHGKLHYELSGGWNVAPAILTRGNGSCSEYSFVFIAMCRAAGLPTRYVGAVTVRGDDASTDGVFHRWCECYLPGYEWVPVDPSGGDQDSPETVAEYFGHTSNRFLITTEGGGASRYMGWGYNANVTWTALGPVNVHIERFGEWSPLSESSPTDTIDEIGSASCQVK
ncbi:MAG: transglutaminase [bacterium]|nr:transglutaminase [bacterium]